jgi:SAM-dependent methyltransferase
MTDAQSRHDAWSAGDAYDTYMGRWSRRIAPIFLDWLAAPLQAQWLDVGCGTGALSSAILAQCAPRSVLGIDPSEGFVSTARTKVSDPRANFSVGDAQALQVGDASVDVAVSGLVLNFVPDRLKAIGELKRVTRPGGMVGVYVWDYPGGGVGFLHAFWEAAAKLDLRAVDLAEAVRFPDCTESGLREIATQGGLEVTEVALISSTSRFQNFDDFWRPFTLGAGPAPGYCATLTEDARERLRQYLFDSLLNGTDGPIELPLRAWAFKASVN